MNAKQFVAALAVVAVMSLVGSFSAVYVLQAGAPVHAQDADAVKVVKASSFEVVDKQGNSKAAFAIDKDGAVQLTMLDDKGKPRVQINGGGDQAYVALLDRKGTMRYLVGQDDKTVLQTMNDANGKNRVILEFDDGGKTVYSFLAADGKPSASLTAGTDAPSILLLADPTNKGHVTMFAKDDQASLQLDSGDGSLLASVLGDGRPVIALNKAGSLRLRQMLDKNGEPEFIFLNEKRQAIWRAGEKNSKQEEKPEKKPDDGEK